LTKRSILPVKEAISFAARLASAMIEGQPERIGPELLVRLGGFPRGFPESVLGFFRGQ
jgi:hypothetical protein